VINKNVITVGLIDILGFILIGGVIVVPSVPDVDVVIGVGIFYLVIVFLVFGFVFLFYYREHAGQSYCPKRCPRGFLLNSSVAAVVTPVPLSSQAPLALGANNNNNNESIVEPTTNNNMLTLALRSRAPQTHNIALRKPFNADPDICSIEML
jgi:hypothetical protein